MRLDAIHFILTYLCNCECDHCFLSCSPSSTGTFTFGGMKTMIDECQKIDTIKSLSFEGGEPFLFYPLLLESVRMASEKGYQTSIVTNCYWATIVDDAQSWLRPLIEAGLSMIEVSDDAFHHGKIDETPAKRVMTAARNLGLAAYFIRVVGAAAHENTPEKGAPVYTGSPKFRGRAVEKLTSGLPTRSWDCFTECPLEKLRSPSRVHLDPFGNVHLCQGLTMGNAMDTPLSDLIRNYDPDSHPVIGPLLQGGPAALVRKYAVGHEAHYVDACHLCSVACRALVDQFPEFLAPRQVYGLPNNSDG
ncbi:MAG: radical SAM protein [Solirubrobacterales bacterium]